jgi:hypothetical protein
MLERGLLDLGYRKFLRDAGTDGLCGGEVGVGAREIALPALGDGAPSCGPGWMPWTISAAISTAVTGPVGEPSASIGTKAPVEVALFADSGPATAPWPNSFTAGRRSFERETSESP